MSDEILMDTSTLMTTSDGGTGTVCFGMIEDSKLERAEGP